MREPVAGCTCLGCAANAAGRVDEEGGRACEELSPQDEGSGEEGGHERVGGRWVVLVQEPQSRGWLRVCANEARGGWIDEMMAAMTRIPSAMAFARKSIGRGVSALCIPVRSG